MPSVKGIYHHKDGVDIDFSVPIAGLSRVNGISRLSIAENDLTQTKLDQRLAALDLKTDERYGFKVEFVDDPSVPPETLLRVRDMPPPREDLIVPHNTVVWLDGFESRDFGPWVGTVGGQAEVQTGTIIDGAFTGHFGYSGGPGSDQGDCSSPLYESTGGTATRTRTYTIFRARITAFAASSSGHTTILNYHDGSGAIPHLQITEDGEISVSTQDTVYNGSFALSLDTTYWFGFYLEIDSAEDGWVLGRVWDSDGNLLDEVGIESPASSEDIGQVSWTHVHVGAVFNNTPLEIFIDSVYSDDGSDWPPLGRVSKTMHPTGVGSENGWATVSPAVDKWLNVDDLNSGTVDDDSTYVGTTGSSQRLQTFDHVGHSAAGIPADATIEAVMLFNREKRTSGFIAGYRTRMKAGASVQESALGDSFAGWVWFQPLLRNTHPGGSPWNTKSLTDLDALEIGARHTASTRRMSACHLQAYYTEPPPEAAAFVPKVMMF